MQPIPTNNNEHLTGDNEQPGTNNKTTNNSDTRQSTAITRQQIAAINYTPTGTPNNNNQHPTTDSQQIVSWWKILNYMKRQNNQQEAKHSYPVFPPLAHHNPQSDSGWNCTVVLALSVTDLKLTIVIVFLSSILVYEFEPEKKSQIAAFDGRQCRSTQTKLKLIPLSLSIS